MTIDRHVHRFNPPFSEHDQKLHCVHFARLFHGNKPVGKWMPNTTHKHAEHNALRVLRSRKKRCNDHLTMVVVRFSRADERLAMSKPCTRCVEMLKTRHINTVMYSDSDGKMVVANISTMTHAPSSMACNIQSTGRVISYSKLASGFREHEMKTI